MNDENKDFPDKGKANAWKWVRRVGTAVLGVAALAAVALVLRRKPPGKGRPGGAGPLDGNGKGRTRGGGGWDINRMEDELTS